MKRLALLALLALPTTAHAAPTPANPSTASIAADRPLYTWSLAAEERVNTITVASAPGVTPEGEFYSENRVTGDALQSTATSWQDARKLGAGTYWWNLNWYAADYSSSGYTTPLSFTVPAYVRSLIVMVRQPAYSADEFRVSYVANTKVVRVRCDLRHGLRLLKSTRRMSPYNVIGGRSAQTCVMRIPAVYSGKRLRIVVTVTAGLRRVVGARSFVVV